MPAKLLADCLKAAVFFESSEVMRAPANRFTLRDDDSRWGADDYLFSGVARLLFRVVAFALLFILGFALWLFYSINDESQFGISLLKLFDRTNALASPLLLFLGERKDFSSSLLISRQDLFKEGAHIRDVS